jgi:hypothetical protein
VRCGAVRCGAVRCLAWPGLAGAPGNASLCLCLSALPQTRMQSHDALSSCMLAITFLCRLIWLGNAAAGLGHLPLPALPCPHSHSHPHSHPHPHPLLPFSLSTRRSPRGPTVRWVVRPSSNSPCPSAPNPPRPDVKRLSRRPTCWRGEAACILWPHRRIHGLSDVCHVVGKPLRVSSPRTHAPQDDARFRRTSSPPPAAPDDSIASELPEHKLGLSCLTTRHSLPLFAFAVAPTRPPPPCKCFTSAAAWPISLCSQRPVLGPAYAALPAADRTSCPSILLFLDNRLHMIQMLEDDPVRIPPIPRPNAACAPRYCKRQVPRLPLMPLTAHCDCTSNSHCRPAPYPLLLCTSGRL